MQITEELIDRFLANECTEEEADKVSAYLKTNPSALEKHLKEKWEEAPFTGELPVGYKAAMWQTISEHTLTKKQTGKWYNMPFVKIAASLLLILGSWLMFQLAGSSANRKEAAVVLKEAGPDDKEITKVNRTGAALTIQLPDHSSVTLSDGARIKYAAAFRGNKRDVYLDGVAFFEVAKDHKKPFTVYSGRFSTTALGTSFSVDENQNGCTVKLYTGKVVIKATAAAVAGWNRNIFLTPHQQMHYDAIGQSVAVAGFGKIEKDVIAKKKPTESNIQTNNALVFENAPLPEVINKLMKRYNTTIIYDRTEIGKMYFSGAVLESDALPLILNVIARMNQLVISQTANGFLVSKSK